MFNGRHDFITPLRWFTAIVLAHIHLSLILLNLTVSNMMNKLSGQPDSYDKK